VETEVPKSLTSNEIVILQPIGSLFFAGTAEFEEHLPDVDEAHHSVVILRLRDRDEVGSTFIQAVNRFTKELQVHDNKLILVGISTHVWDQLEKTGLLDLIGRENVYRAEPQYAASLDKALADANQWLDETTENPTGE
jgi:SulP family sulfate permease